MLDTRGSGIKYTREELSEFKKVADLFFNDHREIYAELLIDKNNQNVYFREWSSKNGDGFNFCIISSMSELKEELKKDVDHGDLAPGRVNKICDDLKDFFK